MKNLLPQNNALGMRRYRIIIFIGNNPKIIIILISLYNRFISHLIVPKNKKHRKNVESSSTLNLATGVNVPVNKPNAI